MRCPDDLRLASVASWLPPRTTTADAVRAGLVDAARIAESDYASVCTAGDDDAPPLMAARAAATALRRSGLGPKELGLLLHCSIWFQGVDVWPAGSYVARRLGTSAPAVDVQQRCNGSLAALQLGVGHLQTGDGAVLISTADRFSLPAVDRWSMHELSVYGDGASAAVLTRGHGFARVLSVATVADNKLEAMTRGDEPFQTHSVAGDKPIDLVRRSAEFHAANDATRVHLGVMRTMTRSAMLALRDADSRVSDMRRVVCGATGKFAGGAHFHSMIGAEENQLTWDFGRTTGHVGTGDWFLGLEYLVRSRQVDPGDRVLLFGGGAGYSCTSVVVEILDVPDWPVLDDPDSHLVGAP